MNKIRLKTVHVINWYLINFPASHDLAQSHFIVGE